MSISAHLQIETPSLKQGKPLVVAGLRERYNTSTVNDIPALWQRLGSYFGKLPAQVGREAYGLVMNMDEADSFDYLAGVEVSGGGGLPRELNVISLPAQRYAIFSHREHVSKLKDTMNAIWNQWAPSWGRRVERKSADAPAMIEYYGPDFNPQIGIGNIEVWVPIEK
jgi:AraC family transcriptional regulator